MSTKSRPDKRPLLFPASGRIMPFTGLRPDNQAFLYPVSGRIIRPFYIQYPSGESGLFIIYGIRLESDLSYLISEVQTSQCCRLNQKPHVSQRSQHALR